MKRVFDILLALAVFLVLSPFMLLAACLVRTTMGAPVLFRQIRPGLNEKPFVMHKFRTMIDVRDACGDPLSDGERIGKFGRFLRSTSLDELPELINVIKGDMSLVGPRPLLMRYLGRYSPEQARRHMVKPGMTGWAQIHGRNDITWDEKFKLDVWYVDNRSFALDLRIVLITILKVIRREGISQKGESTMEEFFPIEENSESV